jgi:predicted heme/steroid binding protein
MVKELMQNIPVIVVTGIAAITSGTAVSKIATELNPLLANKGTEIREARTGSVENSTDSKLVVNNDSAASAAGSTSVTTASVAKPQVAAGTQFTLATLAQHNQSGDCYVAYKTVVYDVSSNPSWQGCTHHGKSGGSDITAVFPHSTSYFNSLPKAGTLIGGSTGGGTTTRTDDDDDDEHEEEDEREDDSDTDDDDRDESDNEDEREGDDD